MTYNRKLPSIKLEFTGGAGGYVPKNPSISDAGPNFAPDFATSTKHQNVEIYIDFLCPFCGKFFYNYAPRLRELLDSGKINLTLYPLAWIDFFSNHQHYSVRSSLATAIVQAQQPDRLWNFVCRLLTRGEQPHEAARYDIQQGSNEHIAKDAAEVGISDAICAQILEVSAQSHQGQQLIAEGKYLRDNALIPGTPSVYIDDILNETG